MARPNDRLVDCLERAADDHGEPLSEQSYENWAQRRRSRGDRVPDVGVLVMHFGSWVGACRAAGVVAAGHRSRRPGSAPGRPRTHHDARGHMLTALRQAADELGEPLSTRAYDEWAKNQRAVGDDVPTRTTITRHVGPWRQACNEAEVEPPEPPARLDPDEAVSLLQRAAEELGEPVPMRVYDAWARSDDTTPVALTIARCFGSWRRACRAAGIRADERGGREPTGRRPPNRPR